MRKFKKIFKVLNLLFSVGFFSPFVLACSSKNQFYFANFENYTSQDLLDSLSEQYQNFNFRSYATNEDLETKFENNYDVATPSTYLIAKMANQNKIEVLDWKKFDIKMTSKGEKEAAKVKGWSLEDNNNQKKAPLNQGWRKGEQIQTSEQALYLFTEQTRNIMTNIYFLNDNNDPNYKKEGGLLNFAIPYFLQDFIFAYKKTSNLTFEKKDYTWKDIIEKIGNQTGKNKPINKIGMIDDFRTIYSIPRLIESNNESVNPGKIQKKEDNIRNQQTYSIEEFVKTYNNLKKFFSNNDSFLLNSDSNIILNDLANRNGNQASILYNGDAIFAFQGGDNYLGDEDWIKSNFDGDEFLLDFIRPVSTLVALDAMVINKNSKQKDQAYEVIKKIGLEGVDDDEEFIYKVNDKDEYVYGPMINFDYVNYVSPIQSLYDYVIYNSDDEKQNENSTEDQEEKSGYFDDALSGDEGVKKYLTESQFKVFKKTLIDIFRIDNPSFQNTLEQNLSDINKSNMYFAYQEIRQKL